MATAYLLHPIPSNRMRYPKPPATSFKPTDASFKTTQWNVILASADVDNREGQLALERFCRLYWAPIYVFLRSQGYDNRTAEDYTQGFFADFLSRRGLAGVSPEKGRFRSFLIVSLKHFVSRERAKERALKRGGHCQRISLDAHVLAELEQSVGAQSLSPEWAYDQRWALTLLREVRRRLRAEYVAAAKEMLFDQLIPLALGLSERSKSQSEIGEHLGLTTSTVKSELYRLRQRFARYLREEVASTVADPSEIDDELRHLIQVTAKQL